MSQTLERPRTSKSAGSYFAGVMTVLEMELRQRMRSRGWYILMGVWFVLIGAVTALTWAAWASAVPNSGGEDMSSTSMQTPGPLIFEVIMAFVLLFALLVAPAFSANAVNGDRVNGTLAILQVTLLRPGQILWGKFLASWIAGLAFLVVSVPFLAVGVLLGGLGFSHILVALLMLAVEIALVSAAGVGISALANRPLFSIVITYLVVAALTVGTLIAFGLSMAFTQGTTQGNEVHWKGYDLENALPADAVITDQNETYVCYGPLRDKETVHTERVTWLLSMNPFVVVADAIPYPQHGSEESSDKGVFEAISQGTRSLQAGPAGQSECVNGKVRPTYWGQAAPLWPIGLGLQIAPIAVIIFFGWRSLRTPAGKLAAGTRIA